MIELERSYIFPADDIPRILSFLNMQVSGDPVTINDCYLNRNLRIRTTPGGSVITRKVGEKSSGHRIESEYPLNNDAASALSHDSQLKIVKHRYPIFHITKNFRMTLDIVDIPMKIAILEIESITNEMPPTAHAIFNKDLTECPLSAWDLFKQKIGICGAPSCGKTEMAKTLSGLFNTRLKANSFHVVEYATSFIQKYDRQPNPLDQFVLWHSQRSRENDAASKADIIVSDCPTFLSYIYMMFNNNEKMNKQFRIHLSKLYKRILEDLDSYNKIIYLRPQESVGNNIRFHTDDQIRDIANRIHSFLQWHNIPHMVAERTDAQKIIDALFYFNTIPKEGQKL